MKMSNTTMMKVIFLTLGISFLLFGVIMITVSSGVNLRMDGCRQVRATVAEVVKAPRRGRHRRYSYVYEYTDGGEVRRYKSNATTTVRLKIGSEKTLYISEDGRIYEHTGAAMTFLVGIVFAVMGGTFMLFTLKMRKKKSEEAER